MSIPRSSLASLAALAACLALMWIATQRGGGDGAPAQSVGLARDVGAERSVRPDLARPLDDEGGSREVAGRPVAAVAVTALVRPDDAPAAGQRCHLFGVGQRQVQALDEAGQAVFEVEVAGTAPAEFEVVVIPARRSGLQSALSSSTAVASWRSSARLEVGAGERAAVELSLLRAAELHVVIVDEAGAPCAAVTGFHFVDDAGRWVAPEVQRTGKDGSIHLLGLRPGRHLIAPAPSEPRWFPPTSVQLGLGQSERLQLRTRAARKVPVEVRVVGETSGEPWPLPVDVSFARVDSIAELLPSNAPRAEHRRGVPALVTAFESVRSPAELQPDLVPGRHWVTVNRATNFTDRFIAPDLEVRVPFELPESGHAPTVVEVRAPDVGPVTVLEVTLSRPMARTATVASELAAPRLVARTWDPSGGERETPLAKGLFGQTRLWIDHAECASNVQFVQVLGDRHTVLETVPLAPGEQQITLTPRGFD